MYIVGVDLSINYPAFCLCKDFDNFEFYGYINDPRISMPKLIFAQNGTQSYEYVKIVNMEAQRKMTKVYHVDERNKLMNFNRLVSAISIELKKRTCDDDVVLAMEGISYGSSGSSLVDICMLTGMFRREMLMNVLGNRPNSFFVFSPSELKMAIGLKGNATKTEILAQFLDDPGIDAVRDSDMYRFMRDHIPHEDGPNPQSSEYVYNTNTDEIGSPYNDMIDAYLNVLKIYRNLST